MATKYILFHSALNGYIPIAFPDCIDHNRVKIEGMTPVSAGFCFLEPNATETCGKSTTLNLKPQAGDAHFLNLLVK